MTFTEVRETLLAFPEVAEAPHFHRTSFRVRGKIIATAIPDEPFVNVMAGESIREPWLAMYPDAVEKLFWGKKVAGLRVSLTNAKPQMLAELLEQTFKEKAPKSLHASLVRRGD